MCPARRTSRCSRPAWNTSPPDSRSTHVTAEGPRFRDFPERGPSAVFVCLCFVCLCFVNRVTGRQSGFRNRSQRAETRLLHLCTDFASPNKPGGLYMAPRTRYAKHKPCNYNAHTRGITDSVPYISHLAKSQPPNLPYISEIAAQIPVSRIQFHASAIFPTCLMPTPGYSQRREVRRPLWFEAVSSRGATTRFP